MREWMAKLRETARRRLRFSPASLTLSVAFLPAGMTQRGSLRAHSESEAPVPAL